MRHWDGYSKLVTKELISGGAQKQTMTASLKQTASSVIMDMHLFFFFNALIQIVSSVHEIFLTL